MDAKHPVSLLQELMAQKRKQLPEYEITDMSTKGNPSFSCIVKVDNIEGTATATSKQAAKKEAALHILKLLEHDCSKVKSDVSPAVSYNAVGKLNETTAKKKLPYATYHECGVTDDGKFKIKCNLLDDFTEACAQTKKAAKKLAADTMLKILAEKDLPSPTNSPKSNLSEEVNDVLKKVEELSLSAKPEEPAKKLNKQKSETKTNNVKSKALDLKNKENLLKTIKDFNETILNMNVTYTIDVMTRNPFELVLTIKNGQNTTAVGLGLDYKEAFYNVLENVLASLISSGRE